MCVKYMSSTHLPYTCIPNEVLEYLNPLAKNCNPSATIHTKRKRVLNAFQTP